MEDLLSFLYKNYQRCPHHPLLNAYFKLEGAGISSFLTLRPGGFLFQAEWFEADGIRTTGEPLNKSGNRVEVMVNPDKTEMLARIGGDDSEEWHRIIFSGLSRDVTRWILRDLDNGRQLCSQNAIPDSSLCASIFGSEQRERASQPKPKKAKTTSKKWRVIVPVVIALLIAGTALVVYWLYWKAPAVQRDVAFLSQSAPPLAAIPPASSPAAAGAPKWQDGPWIRL